MSDNFENDELLKRLRAEDPAADDAEAPGEREAVRSRVTEMLGSSDSPGTSRRITPPRVAVAAVILVLGVGVGLALTLGGSSSGPAPALAIEKTPKWVTLTLTDPNASQDEMNQELADAGIDRVRVMSVPGPPKAVGTWPGYVEFGPHCEGGVTKFGYDVDIPISHPYNRANKHGAEDVFDLTLKHHTGALISEEVGDPYSKSIVRLPTDSIDDPRNAAKVLVAVRPRSPDDSPDANDIGPDQLVALGGVLGQYGEAVKSGRTSCSDFGLKPYPKPDYSFPPPGNEWVALHISGTEAGASRMDRELRDGRINGQVRLLPTVPDKVGKYLGYDRMPPLPKHIHARGNELDITPPFQPPKSHKPLPNAIALRRSAFNAFPNARWIFYVGRAPHPGESPKLLSLDGPIDADAALKRGCPGLTTVTTPKGDKYCDSGLSLQVPDPPHGH